MPELTDALMGGFLFGDKRFLFLLGVLCTILPLPPISFSVLDSELGQKLGSLFLVTATAPHQIYIYIAGRLVVLPPPQICLLKILYTSEYKLYWTVIFILIELCLMEMPFAFKFVDTSITTNTIVLMILFCLLPLQTQWPLLPYHRAAENTAGF